MKKCYKTSHEEEKDTDWIGHILGGNCLLKQVIEGKIEERFDMEIRRGRRCKQLLDGLKEKRGYCKLKGGAQDRTAWRTGFGSGNGNLRIKQTTRCIKYSKFILS
jgi:hypothetical protein